MGCSNWQLAISAAGLPTQELNLRHDVSIVVFHKRDLLFSTAGATEFNEREVEVKSLTDSFGGGELELHSGDPNELKNIRPGEWLLLYGQDPNTGSATGVPIRWFSQWYRILAVDEEDDETPEQRLVSVKGPDWPWTAGTPMNTHVGLFQGAVAVFTRSMKLEGDSPWSLE